VRPTEGETDFALFGERPIADVAVDLKHAFEAGQMGDRLQPFSIRRVDVGDRRRVGAAPGTVIPGVSPELSGLRPPTPGIEDRGGRLVGEQLRRGPQAGENALVDRPQVEGGAADPVGERRTIEPKRIELAQKRREARRKPKSGI
jgi:hypothetical protein